MMDPKKEDEAYMEKYPAEPVLPPFCKHEPGTMGWFRYHTAQAPDDAPITVFGAGNQAIEIQQGRYTAKIGEMGSFAFEVMLSDLCTGAHQRNKDHRIRMQDGDYRVVAPKAQKPNKNRRCYINGELILEKRGRDSLGAETWTRICSYTENNNGDESNALFQLLSNGGDLEIPF